MKAQLCRSRAYTYFHKLGKKCQKENSNFWIQ